MAQQRKKKDDGVERFEGSTIEEVLKEVRSKLGKDAQILEANKLRSGGVGGFFSRESVEVKARRRPAGALPAGIDEALFDKAAAHVASSRGAVERAAAAEQGAAQTPTGASSLMDLADRVSAAEQQATGPSTTPPAQRPAAGSAPSPASAQSPTPAQTQAPAQPTRTSQPAAARPTPAPAIRPLLPPADFEPMTAEGMPRLSTEGGAFNDVMSRIATEAGAEIAEAVDRRLSPPASADSRPLKPVGPQARSRADLAARKAAPEATDHPAVVTGQHLPDSPVGSATASSVLRDNLLNTPGERVADPVDIVAVPAPAPRQAVDAPAARAAEPAAAGEGGAMPPLSDLIHSPNPATEQGDRTARLLSWLQRDNLPKTTVLTALRGLPTVPALPDTTGVVVVVVGKRGEALKLCKRMAKGFDPDQVVLASRSYKGKSIPEERRIIDVTDAARDRASWRRREQPTFVAVESPSSVATASLTWTREIVDELEAHQVIGICSASRKTEDTAAWAERIGGLDALALTDLDETTTPYAILALEIPVAWLDDQKATPGEWAHVLLEENAR